MIAGTIPIKTPEGQAELSTRQRRVSQRHRTVLFLVDGKRDVVEVRSLALRAGVPESCFDDLVGLGLIMLPEPTFSLLIETPEPPIDVLHVDLPLVGPDNFVADSVHASLDSVLPPSRSLYSESVTSDSALGDMPVPDSWLPSDSGGQVPQDPSFVEARMILLRAVRAEAPLAGSLTAMRLRRARNRSDLTELLDEVEARITKPHRALAANHTMRRVRQLLTGHADSTLEHA